MKFAILILNNRHISPLQMISIYNIISKLNLVKNEKLEKKFEYFFQYLLTYFYCTPTRDGTHGTWFWIMNSCLGRVYIISTQIKFSFQIYQTNIICHQTTIFVLFRGWSSTLKNVFQLISNALILILLIKIISKYGIKNFLRLDSFKEIGSLDDQPYSQDESNSL